MRKVTLVADVADSPSSFPWNLESFTVNPKDVELLVPGTYNVPARLADCVNARNSMSLMTNSIMILNRRSVGYCSQIPNTAKESITLQRTPLITRSFALLNLS